MRKFVVHFCNNTPPLVFSLADNDDLETEIDDGVLSIKINGDRKLMVDSGCWAHTLLTNSDDTFTTTYESKVLHDMRGPK